jgi:CubicO group peptidase (beta-lactamase class C family)
MAIDEPQVAAVQDDGWETVPPEAVGMDSGVLAGLAPQFEAWTEANLHSALILRHGKLVYERYFAGEDVAWGTDLGRVAHHAGLRHDLRSITKSVTSLIFGIAVDRGLIGDLDQPVFAFFPDYAELGTPEKSKITLRHLLTMSAGFDWNEDIPYRDPLNSEHQMIVAPDRVRYVLDQPMARPAGAAYIYCAGATALLAVIIERASGRPIDAFAQEHLLAPLGVADVEWARYADGAPNAASGLRMCPRDLAKIGQLVLNGGVWNGKQIVSKAWVDESTSPQINGYGLFFYGFQWWLGRSLVNRKEIKWISGVGLGGQRLYVVPSLDLAVVVNAGLYDENSVLQNIVGETVLRRYALAAALSG